MSGLDRNRFRNKTICFRASFEESRMINERIIISGLPKGKFILESLLHQEISIAVGKFASDRLSLEIRRLKEALENAGTEHKDLYVMLTDCRALLLQLIDIISGNDADSISGDDFRSGVVKEKAPE